MSLFNTGPPCPYLGRRVSGDGSGANRNIKKLQSVQNAAARLIAGTRLCEHITPVLRELHWLPVRRRVDFKVACLAYQSLSGQAPQYLAADIQLISDSGRRHLRSASDRRCVVPRTQNTLVFASPDHACGTVFLGVSV